MNTSRRQYLLSSSFRFCIECLQNKHYNKSKGSASESFKNGIGDEGKITGFDEEKCKVMHNNEE